jgi:hypothetical protein
MSERNTTLTAPPAARAAVETRVQGTSYQPGTTSTLRPGDRLRLTARALKVTTVVEPTAVAGFTVPNGAARVPFVVSVDGQTITGSFNAKSLRKAVAAIAEHGLDQVAIVVQGRLVGAELTEAGIAVQVRAPKP